MTRIDDAVTRTAQAFALDVVVGQDQWGFDAYFFKAESFEAMEQGAVLAMDLIAHDLFAAMRIVLDQEAAIDFQITSLDRQNQQVPLGRDNHDVELANVLLATANGGPWQF